MQCIILALIAGTGHVRAQPSPEFRPVALVSEDNMLVRSDESLHLLLDGRVDIINFRLHEAERSFTHLANLPDGRPAGLYHLSMVSFFRYLMSDDEEDRVEFEARSGELKRELNGLQDSPWRALLGAETNLQRAIVRAKNGQYLRAALAARTAYQEFERIVSEYPELYDAHKGYGLLKLAIGSMPTTYQRFLSLIGFSGNVDQGLKSLDLAARRGRYSFEEATALGALASVLLLEPSDGMAGMSTLNTQYPESVLFAHLYGYVLFENREGEQAEALFRQVVNSNRDSKYFVIDYAKYFLGLSLYRMNRFDEAEIHLSDYVRDHRGFALRAPALLSLGVSIEMQGRRPEAIQYYRQVQAAREFDLDAVSKRKAEQLITQPLTGVLEELLVAANSYDAGDYKSAEAALLEILSDELVEVECAAEASYRLGRVYHATSREHLALTSYQRAVELRGEPLSRWAPWSEYYSGRIHEARHDNNPALHAYERALDYREKYDYYQALEKNAKLGLRRVK